ncbi:MAG: MOSC domain-containing protein [Hyphomicrobiales bacterium]|nr:MOSC domain-containing protein [Hyphomicrobiales bacterium]
MARIVSIYCYPVKGMTPQKLESANLTPGQTIPYDRAYAVENGPGRFNPDEPKYLPKINFLMLMRHERLAALKSEFDEASETLTIFRDGRQVARGQLSSKLGRQMIEQFLASYMQAELKGPPRIVQAPGHSFSDVSAKCLHFVNLATVRELERVVGKTLDPLRFRANVYFDGAEPWAETKWVGRTIAVGEARLKAFAETERCDATNVNPATAARDASIPPTLIRTFGHSHLGIYATVKSGGVIRPGDQVDASVENAGA